MGDRAAELSAAIASIGDEPVVVVWNGGEPHPISGAPRTIASSDNVGVPGGRDVGARSSSADVIGFLDDDAVLEAGASDMVRAAFAADERLGAVALRLIDEDGRTARRHAPRIGAGRPDEGGDVAYFLGGACAIRRTAYVDAGGYFTDLFYGHEELELGWRLIDRGWRIRYLADVSVFHPRTAIERHADGWRMTGRNRVMVARRTLPWPVAVVHVTMWLGLGAFRAPAGVQRKAYLRGWRQGWSVSVDRRAVAWSTVWRLTRLGRPPIV